MKRAWMLLAVLALGCMDQEKQTKIDKVVFMNSQQYATFETDPKTKIVTEKQFGGVKIVVDVKPEDHMWSEYRDGVRYIHVRSLDDISQAVRVPPPNND
jgi:hypothetical protein